MSGISFTSGVRQRFILQVKSILGEWETEPLVFNCIDGAIRYGDNRFSQNEWRVVGRNDGVQHAYSSPLQGLAVDAAETLTRFQAVADMREYFESQRQAREERREAAEADRLEAEAHQLFLLQEQMVGRQQQQPLDYFGYVDDPEDHFVSDPIEAVDWVKEGF